MSAASDNQRTLESFGYKQELKRSVSTVDLLIYGLIFMVPIAPFGIFGSVFQASGGMIALAYAIGGVAMAFTAVSYSQMAQAFPMAGSVSAGAEGLPMRVTKSTTAIKMRRTPAMLIGRSNNDSAARTPAITPITPGRKSPGWVTQKPMPMMASRKRR